MKKSGYWIVGFVALMVIAAITFFFRAKIDNVAVTYREVMVARGNLAVTILATGTVQPANRLEIKPPIPGRVERVLVKEGEIVKKGQILAWMSSTERAAMLDAARSQGADEVRKWEELYRPTPILAPISGTIISRNVESGQTFTNTEAILVMSDRLTVKAQVDETDIATVKVQQKAVIILDAYAAHHIDAKVEQIAYEAKTVNNVTTYTVDVLPLETPDYMRAGMTANVTFYVESKENVLLVPTEAVKQSQQGESQITIKGADGKTSERNIVIGVTDGKQTEVQSGLSEGDIIMVTQLNMDAKSPGSTNPFMPRPGGAAKGKAR